MSEYGDEQLHPDLARLAARYDFITDQWADGLIDDQEASRQINALRARDDNGVVWRMSPMAVWERQEPSGNWVEAEPPAKGIRPLTPQDVSGNINTFNPDAQLLHSPAKRSQLEQGEGSTWAPNRVFSSNNPQKVGGRELPSWKTIVAALAVAVLAVLIIEFLVGGLGKDSPSTPPSNHNLPTTTIAAD